MGALLAAVLIVAAGVAYAAYTSITPGTDPCSGVPTIRSPAVTTPRAPGATGRGFGPSAGVQAPTPARGSAADPLRAVRTSATPVPVVAAENFWGSLVAQLGGNHTSVLSIVSDPNADPHEYEGNTSDAIAINDAQLVVVNGVGYDQWALGMIAADNHPGQIVLNAGDLNGVTLGGGIVSGNPHLWYNPGYVNRTVAAMFADLVTLDPGHASDYAANYAALNTSLAKLYGEAHDIRAQFAGSIVAATEDIFVYLANYTGLDLVSPAEFMQAVAEGNDPPAQSVVTFQCQLESGQVHALVYNEQTVTPITDSMKALAAQHHVPLVAVTETIQPPGTPFQTWMGSEYLQLYNTLNGSSPG